MKEIIVPFTKENKTVARWYKWVHCKSSYSELHIKSERKLYPADSKVWFFVGTWPKFGVVHTPFGPMFVLFVPSPFSTSPPTGASNSRNQCTCARPVCARVLANNHCPSPKCSAFVCCASESPCVRVCANISLEARDNKAQAPSPQPTKQVTSPQFNHLRTLCCGLGTVNEHASVLIQQLIQPRQGA
jgi:hypothetical protein